MSPRDNDVWTSYIRSLLSSTQVLSTIYSPFEPTVSRIIRVIQSIVFFFMFSTCAQHWRILWNAMRSIDPEEDHIHVKLMKLYPEVPKWWYWRILVLFFLMVVI